MGQITKSDYKFFEAAKKVALESDFEKFHVGCVIVYKKHIISSAANSNKTHPIQKKYNRRYREFNCTTTRPIQDKVHAEIAALSKIPYPTEQIIDWKKVSIYVYRYSKGLKSGHGMARPCPGCLKALRNKGIKKIYYTTKEGYCLEEF